MKNKEYGWITKKKKRYIIDLDKEGAIELLTVLAGQFNDNIYWDIVDKKRNVRGIGDELFVDLKEILK